MIDNKLKLADATV